MKTYSADTITQSDIQQAIYEDLRSGAGAVKISDLFSEAQISQARKIIMDHSDNAVEKVSHFQGKAEAEGKLNLQRRVWNLLAKGDIFTELSAEPRLLSLLRGFLGSEFIMGSIAANRILPGGPGQEPHIDYPYWDFHQPDTHPLGINASFPLNTQVTILLDDFTEENGATAYVPGSQVTLRYPDENDNFYDICERMTGKKGDVVVFFGAAWHCAMPNHSQQDRNAVLLQYLPKFIKPMENMAAALPEQYLASVNEDMRQLLGFKYPYPQILDEAGYANTEGRN
jgi:ectoine hydroxylase-related dioxygenase (phytanoyl-CoA dioxygenase family)